MPLGVYDFVSIGSLTQEDPLGLAGGLNLYGFAGGDPVNFSDPFGLLPCLAKDKDCGGAWSAIKGFFAQWWQDATDPQQNRDLLDAAAFIPVVGTIGKAEAGIEDVGAPVGFVERIGAKIGRILSHLTRADLSGAAKELRSVATGYDHLTEVREAAQGLRNQIRRINGFLSNPRLTPEERAAAEPSSGAQAVPWTPRREP